VRRRARKEIRFGIPRSPRTSPLLEAPITWKEEGKKVKRVLKKKGADDQ
jgi:hypothetical protein